VTSIFLDASGLVPMEVARDQWRPRLERVMAGLRRGGRVSFVTSTWTLYEALALVRRREERRVRHLYDRASETMSIVAVDPATEDEALRRFLTWTDKGASVVDHANLLVAVRTGCEAILSFDDDFSPLVHVAGLRLLR
jgi:predicted nucleic acid-binding protein